MSSQPNPSGQANEAGGRLAGTFEWGTRTDRPKRLFNYGSLVVFGCFVMFAAEFATRNHLSEAFDNLRTTLYVVGTAICGGAAIGAIRFGGLPNLCVGISGLTWVMFVLFLFARSVLSMLWS